MPVGKMMRGIAAGFGVRRVYGDYIAFFRYIGKGYKRLAAACEWLGRIPPAIPALTRRVACQHFHPKPACPVGNYRAYMPQPYYSQGQPLPVIPPEGENRSPHILRHRRGIASGG